MKKVFIGIVIVLLLLVSGKTFVEFTADKKGTFEYYCSVGEHRVNGMKGKFIVE